MFSFSFFISFIIPGFFVIISGLVSSEALAPELLIFVKGYCPIRFLKAVDKIRPVKIVEAT